MRTITQIAVKKFLNEENFRKDNTKSKRRWPQIRQ